MSQREKEREKDREKKKERELMLNDTHKSRLYTDILVVWNILSYEMKMI